MSYKQRLTIAANRAVKDNSVQYPYGIRMVVGQ
jgi:hypothetical protein